MKLDRAFAALEKIAPLHLAAPWDNVGPILRPSPACERPVRRILLAIDCTAAVVEEAIESETDLLVCYHPPIFEGAKRLLGTDPRGGPLVRLIENAIAVYSPHTALDAVPGGVNDWLADGLRAGPREPIEPAVTAPPGVGFRADVPRGAGQGRYATLLVDLPLETVVERVKKHLGLTHVRVAPAATKIRTVALCAGAGGSVVRQRRADLYLTGEMRHHDILEANERGTSVIVAGHSNTERGYLSVLAKKLPKSVRVAIAREDRDPLGIR